MSFSVGLKLADLDDFIAPSQECIKPVVIEKKVQKVCFMQQSRCRYLYRACCHICSLWLNSIGLCFLQKATIEIDDDGGYLQISNDGSSKKLEKASITLNDCLACRYR